MHDLNPSPYADDDRFWCREPNVPARRLAAGTYKVTGYVHGDAAVRIISESGDVLVAHARRQAQHHAVVVAFQVTYPVDVHVEYALSSPDAAVKAVNIVGTQII